MKGLWKNKCTAYSGHSVESDLHCVSCVCVCIQHE